MFAIVPRSWAKAMEKDSRLWVLECPECGMQTSIWDLGGIRYKAYGRQWNLMRCSKCGLKWHICKKKEPLPSELPA